MLASRIKATTTVTITNFLSRFAAKTQIDTKTLVMGVAIKMTVTKVKTAADCNDNKSCHQAPTLGYCTSDASSGCGF